MNEITKIKDLKGKTIVETKRHNGDLWLKFSDDSFAVLVVKDITEGFGYQRDEVNINQYSKDKTEHTLVEFGLISDHEYKDALEKERLEYLLREVGRNEKERERITKYELEQLRLLSEKYQK